MSENLRKYATAELDPAEDSGLRVIDWGFRTDAAAHDEARSIANALPGKRIYVLVAIGFHEAAVRPASFTAFEPPPILLLTAGTPVDTEDMLK